MKVITDTDTLAKACNTLKNNDFLTIDTEFLRETTFWPKLCLIQMAGPDSEVIVDPLADNLDLAPFFELMDDSSVVKVFHAARQDIEIVHHLSRIVPNPIFDSQVAAMVCGFGDSVSYSMLVKKLQGFELDKTSRFTDWSRRPLSDKQLTYALGDVTHLRGVYSILKEQLETTSRASWLEEEMAVLKNPGTYETHPEDAWKRLKMRVKTRKALAVMMELAAWREIQAQTLDVPRSRVIKDDAIYDIANQMPRSLEDLASLRTVHDGFARSNKGRDVLSAVERGLVRNPDSVPEIKKSKPLMPETSAIVDLLRVLLKAIAARHGVATKLIATTDDLEKIALNDQADVRALIGWRLDMFGQHALDIKSGKLALTIEDGSIVTIDRESIGVPDNIDIDVVTDEAEVV